MTGIIKAMAMITFTTGDILSAEVEALVNTVNCVGVMGRGIALQFRNMFPDNFKAYKAACDRNEVQPGKMFVFETRALTYPQYIINFPTKRHWRGKSRMEDIDSGLQALAQEIRACGIRTIAIPPLGSGLGGLDWNAVRPRIEAALQGIHNLDVTIYEPMTHPVSTRSRDIPAMTEGRATLVVLMHRYLAGLMDPFVTLIELQKLMYFMQEAGMPLRLNYSKHFYGPYADTLRHVLNRIEGHLVSGYHDGGDAPDKPLELVPGALEDAQAFLAEHPAHRDHLDRVVHLVEGFESPFGLELLATVHWVATRENARTEEDIVRKVHAWNPRKKQFSQRQIGIAYNMLQKKNWLKAAPSHPVHLVPSA